MNQRPRVVVVGGGFAGLAATRGLASTPVDVLVIDRHNYHLFQPLLYQVATAGLSPSDIAWPIRSLLRRQANARVVLGTVEGVRPDARTVQVGASDIDYDYLVLATGAQHGYFGHEDWEPHAPGLKTVDDATHIRRRILLAFERAEIESDPERRRAYLTFAIVGAGPTGSTRVPASMRITRAVPGSMRRKSLASTLRASSTIAPASSTPVGPAPTIANVR